MLRIFRGAGLDFAALVGSDTRARAYPRPVPTRSALRRDPRACLEMLVRRAVIALGERGSLARFALAGRRPATRNTAVERARLDLGLDESDRGGDALGHRPGDLRLRGK
jgi:hypothetical protein